MLSSSPNPGRLTEETMFLFKFKSRKRSLFQLQATRQEQRPWLPWNSPDPYSWQGQPFCSIQAFK